MSDLCGVYTMILLPQNLWDFLWLDGILIVTANHGESKNEWWPTHVLLKPSSEISLNVLDWIAQEYVAYTKRLYCNIPYNCTCMSTAC